MAVTVIVDVPVPAAMGDVAVSVDWAAETAPAFTTTGVVWVIATASMVADTVFEPAAVELKVPVATPLAFVVALGCVSVFPAVGVAASTTVAPSIGLPLASRAVTVTVVVPVAVELKLPVATPLASVVPTGWVRVFPAVGVAASVTVAP